MQALLNSGLNFKALFYPVFRKSPIYKAEGSNPFLAHQCRGWCRQFGFAGFGVYFVFVLPEAEGARPRREGNGGRRSREGGGAPHGAARRTTRGREGAAAFT